MYKNCHKTQCVVFTLIPVASDVLSSAVLVTPDSMQIIRVLPNNNNNKKRCLI